MKWFSKGWRVRKFYRRIKWITFSVLYSPFLIAFLLLVCHDFSILTNGFYVVILLIYLLISILMVIFLNLFCYRQFFFFNQLNHLRVLAVFLIENGFYISKKRNRKKEKIILPKVYLKQDHFTLAATFILQGNKFQERFTKLSNELELMFGGDFMSLNFQKGFVQYILAIDQFSGRLPVTDVVVDDKGLRLMKDVWWDFESEPHLLISGGTGGGKTVLLMSLILGLAKVGYVSICDPKKSDFVGLKDLPVFNHRVYFDKDEMIGCLKQTVEDMDNSYRYMTTRSDYVAGKKYSDYGLKPHFIVFDEWAAFMATLDNDYQSLSLVTEYLTQIVLKGRQAGFFMILAMQRADGEFIKTALRDNFMKRLTVGTLEDTGYTMMFGDANKNKVFKTIKEIDGHKVYGRGYIANAGTIAREFYSPYVDFAHGFDFLEEFKKIKPLNQEDLSISAHKEAIEEGDEKAFFSRQEVSQKLGVSGSKISKVVSLLKDRGITFSTRSGSITYTDDDVLLLRSIFEKKEESGKSYQVIIEEMEKG